MRQIAYADMSRLHVRGGPRAGGYSDLNVALRRYVINLHLYV